MLRLKTKILLLFKVLSAYPNHPKIVKSKYNYKYIFGNLNLKLAVLQTDQGRCGNQARKVPKLFVYLTIFEKHSLECEKVERTIAVNCWR